MVIESGPIASGPCEGQPMGVSWTFYMDWKQPISPRQGKRTFSPLLREEDMVAKGSLQGRFHCCDRWLQAVRVINDSACMTPKLQRYLNTVPRYLHDLPTNADKM